MRRRAVGSYSRCYMNPAGRVPHPDNDGTSLYFSKFRPYFTDAGFAVVDCPRLSHTKNRADIRLVIDAVEALRADIRYDEFVIASGDSDMTPLIVRLRASDDGSRSSPHQTLPSSSQAVADRIIGGQELQEHLDFRPAELHGTLEDSMPMWFSGRMEEGAGTLARTALWVKQRRASSKSLWRSVTPKRRNRSILRRWLTTSGEISER